MILNCKAIINLLNPAPDKSFIPEDLLDEYIYTYNRIPATQEVAKTYITIAMNSLGTSSYNDIIKNAQFVITIISNDSLMRVNGSRGNRIDLIAAEIDYLLNENTSLGFGKLALTASKEGVLESGHPYRSLIFEVDALNNQRCRL